MERPPRWDVYFIREVCPVQKVCHVENESIHFLRFRSFVAIVFT